VKLIVLALPLTRRQVTRHLVPNFLFGRRRRCNPAEVVEARGHHAGFEVHLFHALQHPLPFEVIGEAEEPRRAASRPERNPLIDSLPEKRTST
jgi:hypothetical protein